MADRVKTSTRAHGLWGVDKSIDQSINNVLKYFNLATTIAIHADVVTNIQNII